MLQNTDTNSKRPSQRNETSTVQWSNIHNITDLMSSCSIFSTERRTYKNILYLRCDACNYFMYSVDGREYQFWMKRADTFPNGLKVQPVDEDKLFNGEGREWIHWKSKLKKHFEGSDSFGDSHSKAVIALNAKSQEDSRLLAINKRFIITCLEVIKSKSAALHFETLLSSLQASGVDIGNKQHSPKAIQWIDAKHLHSTVQSNQCKAFPTSAI